MGLKRATRRRIGLGALGIVVLGLALLAWPREDLLLRRVGVEPAAEGLKLRRGLDLQGGVYLVYEAKLENGGAEDLKAKEVLDNTVAVIERRVNPGGTAEVSVRTASNNRIVVELPGVSDPDKAKQLIGRTAQLQFYEVNNSDPTSGVLPTDLSGQDVKRANVDFAPGTGAKPVVSLELKGGESADKFSRLTSALSQSGNLLVTLLDEEVVFGPATVQEPITTGKAQLSGDFDVKQAKEIATLLNAGALPVPVELVAQQVVGPTLGADSIKQSLLAAVIGLVSISLFLLIYYRLIGVVAIGSLIIYGLAMLVIFKLSVLTPYVLVLSLAGIAGFILSIAVAVDTNILIFERFKEELKRGLEPIIGFEEGFTHAWASIRDANAATLISSAILYNFGTPVIRGFALTLGLGVVVNLLVAQTVTKLLMRSLARTRATRLRSWIGSSLQKEST